MAGLLGAAPVLGGCSLATMNVRAAREFANEDPEVNVVLDRLADTEAVLVLVDKLLARTPYSPGDAWVRDLRLTDAQGAAMKERLSKAPPYASGEHEIPIVKLYRLHLEEVLRTSTAPREGQAEHASILDAIATLSPGLSSIKATWERFEAAQSARAVAAKARNQVASEAGLSSSRFAQADTRVKAADQEVTAAKRALLAHAEALRTLELRGPDRAGVGARGALSPASVALRTLLESSALLPNVVVQATHLYQSAARDIWVQHEAKEMLLLSALAPRAEIVEERTVGELKVVEALSESLAEATGGDLYSGSAGFAMRESIVDQVVGVTWDSVRFRLRGDSEILFFNQIGASSGGQAGYVGQTRRLAYDVDPIALVGARVIIAFDWIHVQNAARLNAGFATDRLFSTGGNIVNSSSLGEQLGLEGFASDMFDVGMDLIGIRTKVKSARFTSGEVIEMAVSPMTGRDTGITRRAPLQLSYKQVDIGYDASFLMPEFSGKYWIEELFAGFRFMNYRLPRILYELEDVDPSPDATRYAFGRESPAQTLDSTYYMGGIAARFGQGDRKVVSLFGDVGLYGGSGPASFYFLKQGAVEDVPENRIELRPAMLVFNASAGLGVRLRLTPRKSRFRLLCEAQYHADLVGQTIVSEIAATKTEDKTVYTVSKTINYGGVDLYHGPRLQLVGVF